MFLKFLLVLKGILCKSKNLIQQFLQKYISSLQNVEIQITHGSKQSTTLLQSDMIQ